MGAAENKQLLQHVYAGLAQSDARPFVAAMAEEFCWTMPGSTAWSRTYAGKQAVVRELFPALRAALGDRVTTVAHRFIADGDHVVVEARGRNVTRAGVPYENTYCFVFRLAGGKLAELTEYMDTQLVAQVLPPPSFRA